MNKDGIRILEYAGEGYSRVVNGAKWTLAGLNYADRFDEKNLVDLERHNVTDETFVLLQGEATLLGAAQGEDALPTVGGAVHLTRIKMEPLKYYNVGAGVWHNIIVSKDARVLVAENADTSKDNTDYLEIATGRIFKKRPAFEEVLPGTYLLKVPFGPVWTGVVLISANGCAGRGRPAHSGCGAMWQGRPRPCAEDVNVLIDSSHIDPERYLIPALADLGLKPTDIDWLLNTHVHGDHIGGHHALVTKYGIKTATLRKDADALRDPVKVAIRVRTRFPKNSPAPQSYLKGVEPDLLLDEGALLANRFACISTPGHDDDCQTWIDTKTGTAFTGDSLQANGTPTQGIAFYRDLKAYRETLRKLSSLLPANVARASSPLRGIRNLVLAHDYDGVGCVVKGEDAVKAALDYSAERLAVYEREIKFFAQGEDALPTVGSGSAQGEDALPTADAAKCGKGVPALAQSGDESALVPLTLRLIGKVGCGMPDSLFLAMHSVSEHLKEIAND